MKEHAVLAGSHAFDHFFMILDIARPGVIGIHLAHNSLSSFQRANDCASSGTGAASRTRSLRNNDLPTIFTPRLIEC
jgi:hypothetical protein